MRRLFEVAFCGVAAVTIATPQGNPIDWSSFGNDAQRSGWEKSDSRITRENVKDFQLVLKHRLGAPNGGLHSLTPPVVIGRLISYKGFKELAFVAGAGDHIWTLDADVDRMFWEKTLAGAAKPKDAACAGIVTSQAALTPAVAFGARPRPAPGAAPASAPPPPPPPSGGGILGGTGFGAPRPVFVVSSDGKLHAMRTSDGEELVAGGLEFLPANAKASPLTIADNAIYAATSALCGDSPNAVWAIDVSTATPKVASFPLTEGMPAGTAGFAVGATGTVYVQSVKGSLQALTSKTLALKKSYAVPGGASNVTPTVFTHKNREYVLTSGADGVVYLLDAETLDPVAKSESVGASGVLGGFASWQATDGTRWVVAPTSNKVVGMKLTEADGKPAFAKVWTSGDMVNPMAPVLTGDMAFVLDAGRGKTNARLYALDATTGKEIFTTGRQVTAPAQATGLTIVNARVYFTTTDNTLWAFGVFMER